jgi:hypothetical protein
LRVTDALYDSCPNKENSVIFESEDKTITYLHRIMSVHPLLRAIFEWVQQDVPEDLFAYFYKKNLRSSTKVIYNQLSAIIKSKKIRFHESIIIIATHFFLAHKIAAIKPQLEHEFKLKLYLFLQVTDDSPQHIWYVPEANIIFVPSLYTKEKLLEYKEKNNLAKTTIEIIPYPISSILRKPLSDIEYKERTSQYDPVLETKIKVKVPISGAAVGMNYFKKIIPELYQISNRFEFEIVSKKTLRTQYFLNYLRKYEFVNLHVFEKDREVVDFYERIYDEKIFGFEITKPSEQAFKALANPKEKGGPILLFSDPVGRQEFDNLKFLKLHHLIPTDKEQDVLWQLSEKNEPLKDSEYEDLLNEAIYWRGVRLQKNSYKSARFILWCLKEHIFQEMGKFRIYEKLSDDLKKDIRPDGVVEFWKKIKEYLNPKNI